MNPIVATHAQNSSERPIGANTTKTNAIPNGAAKGISARNISVPSLGRAIIACATSKIRSIAAPKSDTAIIALALITATAQPATARDLTVGAGQVFPTFAAAMAQAKPFDHIRLALGRHADCASITTDDLTIEGAGPADAVVLDGVACEGKGAFVVHANRITIRDMTLTNIRVPNGNGAGIRPEGIDLLVERVRFIDNENGILAAPSQNSTIIVRDSVFERNGVCNPLCAHGIYVNALGLLRVERSRFFETMVGHHIKSRGARTEVIDCDLADGALGTSSYQIDLPNGGALVARGNRIQKGPRSGNPGSVIILGEEGVTQKAGEILVEGNTLVVDGLEGVAFVRNATGVPAVVRGNVVPLGVVALVGAGTVR